MIIGFTVVVLRNINLIRRVRPVEGHDAEFLRANTDRKIKITLPGPITMSRQAKNGFYKDEEELVMDYAAAVNAEIRDLKTLDGLGGKTVILGVISMGDPAPETPETIASRIRAALAHLPPERLIPAPDRRMKYIPRNLSFENLKALAEGAAIVSRELAGS